MSKPQLKISVVIDRLFEIQGVLRCVSSVVDQVNPTNSHEGHLVASVGRSSDLCVAILDDLVEALEDFELAERRSA